MSRWARAKQFLRDNFFSGLLVVVPAVASIYVFYNLVKWLYDKFNFIGLPEDLIRKYLDESVPAWSADLIVGLVHVAEFLALVIAVIALVALAGMVTKVGLVNWFFRLAERVLEKIPIVGVLYSALKQLLESIFSGKGNFNKVVLVEFPRNGIWSVGFVSRESDRSFAALTGKERLYNVFIPTTPNPTNGFLIIVPEDQMIELSITIDQAFKFIMSGGMVLPHEDAGEVLQDDGDLMVKIKGISRKRKW